MYNNGPAKAGHYVLLDPDAPAAVASTLVVSGVGRILLCVVSGFSRILSYVVSGFSRTVSAVVSGFSRTRTRGIWARIGCVVFFASFAIGRDAAAAPAGQAATGEQHVHPAPGAEQQEPAPPAPPEHVHPTQPTGQDSAEGHQHPAESMFASRETSGTAWLPDATPMYGFHRDARGWEVMLHGNGFVQFLYEAAPEHRGAAQGGSINWVMLMGRRPLARGRIGLRTMFSLEPVTIPGCGYPNLLATGEECNGDSIHDRQHPHDLFMELAAEFDRPLTPSLRWQVYAGLAGEPALGPPGFPHRLSAMPNPSSPIAHHWLDSTHVTFGVVTTGLYTARWKAEASVFNGREPDEQRFDLDLAPLDSMSGRLWLLPTESVAFQVSAGHLKDAEAGLSRGTRLDVDRVTASATYHRRFAGRHFWATTVGWGVNREASVATHGVTGESSATFSNRHTWFSRFEVNGKPAHDLHIHEATQVFTVGKVQAGYTRHLDPRHGLIPGIGASLSAAFVPEALKPRYGGVGLGMGVFLNLRPAAHDMTTP